VKRILGIAIACVALLLGGCATSGSGPRQGSVSTLAIGECTADVAPSDGEEISMVTTVGCDQPHAWEAYAETTLTGDAWPGDDKVAQDADDFCVAEFEKFVGIPATESQYSFISLMPTEKGWQAGDHQVTCTVGSDSGDIKGTLRDAKA
jgi:hypothetical protein